MKESLLKNGIIQIATPHSTGTGFILGKERLIITNEHVVRDNREVVVYGFNFRQQIVPVVYLDEKYDLAFLAIPEGFEGATLALEEEQSVAVDDLIYAVGHPYGADFVVQSGNITDLAQINYGIPFIHHTAMLGPGFSGGPLINEAGKVIGVNTFLTRKDEFIGFTLPTDRLIQQIKEFKTSNMPVAALCGNCELLVSEVSIEAHRCPGCNHSIQLASAIKPYQPVGMALTIEQLLSRLGYAAKLARRGVNNWDIVKGSAHINISYYEKSGLIIGDSYLCHLPAQDLSPLYQFLLRQNYQLEGLTLSIKGNAVVLSLLIYDRYLNLDTGSRLFEHLFKTADDLDNILIEQYGASWIKEPPTIEKIEEDDFPELLK